MPSNMPRARPVIDRWKRAAASGCVCWVLAAAPVTAQPAPCTAGVRELADRSPHVRLDLLRPSLRPHDDLISSGADCLWRPEAVREGAWSRIGPLDRMTVVRPVFRLTSLGGIPDPRGDGALWSGRGINALVRTGIGVDAGSLHVVLAPQLLYSQNLSFDFFPSVDPRRSAFASPWYAGTSSADLPSRFGADAFTILEPGETAAWVAVRAFEAGLATSTQRWGPGYRNHLLLGPDTPGIPRVFLRSGQILRIPGGVGIAGSAFLGVVTESRFFDADPRNDQRSLWGWALTAQRGAESPIAVGLAGLTMTEGTHPLAETHESMWSVFARVRSRPDHTRAWVEIGRNRPLPAWREFITAPNRGFAYVVGLEQGIPLGSRLAVVTAEVTTVEQPTALRDGVRSDYYTSGILPHGWTHRGRPLGVPSGPGSQSQWLSLDWVSGTWSAGVFGERVRWNQDAFFDIHLAFGIRHDVTVRGGLRGTGRLGSTEMVAEMGTGKRLNYLFQNADWVPGYRTVDVSIPQLRIFLRPAPAEPR